MLVRSCEITDQREEDDHELLHSPLPWSPCGGRSARRDDRQQHAEQHEHLDAATDPQRRVLHHFLEQRAAAFLLFLIDCPLIPEVEGDEQHGVDQEPLRPETERPLERHALEKTEQQRRVADRGEQSSTVRDNENEEDDGMRDAVSALVRSQQRPDQQDGCARRAHEICEHLPDAGAELLRLGAVTRVHRPVSSRGRRARGTRSRARRSSAAASPRSWPPLRRSRGCGRCGGAGGGSQRDDRRECDHGLVQPQRRARLRDLSRSTGVPPVIPAEARRVRFSGRNPTSAE